MVCLCGLPTDHDLYILVDNKGMRYWQNKVNRRDIISEDDF